MTVNTRRYKLSPSDWHQIERRARRGFALFLLAFLAVGIVLAVV